MSFPGMAVTLWMALTKERVPEQFVVSAIACNRGQSRAGAGADWLGFAQSEKGHTLLEEMTRFGPGGSISADLYAICFLQIAYKLINNSAAAAFAGAVFSVN